MTRARRTLYARQGGTKVHVLDETTERGACGADLWGDEYLARLVPGEDRCGAAGCRHRWPAQLRAVS